MNIFIDPSCVRKSIVLFFSFCVLTTSVFSQETPVQRELSPLQQASVLFQREEYDAALLKLEEVEANDPGNMEMLNLRGAIFMKQEEYQKATLIFQKIATENPGNFGAQFNYGEALFVSGNYPEAKSFFEKARELKGNQKDSLNEFKSVLYRYLPFINKLFRGSCISN
ncbi:MAG: tetratricopeptide repeat protein [Verrucomicrobiota bacterium]